MGGKVAVDLVAGKNLAGAFYQPKLVLMDPETLTTLPDRVFSDGMAEVIKYGCIWDEALFAKLERLGSRPAVMGEITDITTACCDIKRQVVEQDELDLGIRMILNFGHTLGHVYEKAYHYETYTHGEAVAAGMVAAAKLGQKLGHTPAEPMNALRLCWRRSACLLPLKPTGRSARRFWAWTRKTRVRPSTLFFWNGWARRCRWPWTGPHCWRSCKEGLWM